MLFEDNLCKILSFQKQRISDRFNQHSSNSVHLAEPIQDISFQLGHLFWEEVWAVKGSFALDHLVVLGQLFS